MAEVRLSDVLRWTKGELVMSSAADQPDYLFADVTTDTRKCSGGSLFIALSGERFDGHDFAAAALDAGAAGLVLQKNDYLNRSMKLSGLIILVSDTLTALQQIAAGYRLNLTSQVIAISGSVGKTSTREMVASCLKPFYSVHQTQANLNNQIGLPQTLLQTKPSDQVVVLEMGMRARGEISLLSQIAVPDIAILTRIGWSHIEFLGSQEAILQAKAEIIDGLRPDGLLVLNADDPWLEQLAQRLQGQVQLAGFTRTGKSPWPDVQLWLAAEQINPQPHSLSFRVKIKKKVQGQYEHSGVDVCLPFPGLHHIGNVLPGLAVAACWSADLEQAAHGAASCRNTGSRQRIIETDELTIMDDSYNASPESMQAALETLAMMACGRHRLTAVLGGMLELGDYAKEAHRQVGRMAAENGYSFLFCLGSLAQDIADAARLVNPAINVLWYDDMEELCRDLKKTLRAGDYLLVKGSRALAMEKIIDFLKNQQDMLPAETVDKGVGNDSNC